MSFTLADGDRADFKEVFDPPFLWSRLEGDESLRYWQVLVDTRQQLLLSHGTGAIAELTRDGDRVTAVVLHEGAAAEKLLRIHGFPATADLRQRAKRSLKAGRLVEDGLKALFPTRVEAAEIAGTGSCRRFRTPEGAVLEVDVGANAAIADYRLLTGGEALDVLSVIASAKEWDVPVFPGGPFPARTAGEAALFIDVQRGDLLKTRLQGGEYHALAHTPAGVRRFVFGPVAGDPASPDFGEGTSRILDPAELVLYAARVERDLPAQPSPERRPVHVLKLRFAVAALRQAARFAQGDEAPPESAFLSTTSRRLRAVEPARFGATRLNAEAERLELLGKLWAGL